MSEAEMDPVYALKEADTKQHVAAYAEWLAIRARVASDAFSGALKDMELAAALDRQRALGMLICTTPAPTSWALHNKFDVLRAELAEAAADGESCDHRELAMLAGIEADVFAMVS